MEDFKKDKEYEIKLISYTTKFENGGSITNYNKFVILTLPCQCGSIGKKIAKEQN